MAFKINFDETNVSTGNFEIVEEGKYEATILTAELKEWQGQYSIGFGVEIRSDVEQKFQGSKILFNTLYLTSANADYAEDTEKKRNSFLVACGYRGKAELDMEQVVKEIIGKNVLVYVKHKQDNNGKTWAKVTFVATSKAESGVANNEDPFANNKGPIEVDESKLPF